MPRIGKWYDYSMLVAPAHLKQHVYAIQDAQRQNSRSWRLVAYYCRQVGLPATRSGMKRRAPD